jgi:hypothetical protein
VYELLGFCGINCEDCEIRKAANNRDFALRLIDEWNKTNPGVNESQLVCQGCKGEDSICWGNDCAIRICANEKGVDHCGQCFKFKCNLILEFEADEHQHHTSAIRVLEKLSGKPGG